MIYSYIGLSKPITVFNNIMLQKQAAYRKSNFGWLPQLEPGGIYTSSANYDTASLLAADSDMCAYTKLEPLLTKSDIIFLFLPDKALKTASVELGKYPVKGKIFCHFSPKYDASILDFNSANTYLSMHLPYFIKDNGKISSEHIIAEGYGRRLDKITEAFQAMDIPLSLISREEKLMYHTATQISKNMPLMLMYASQRLSKYALASDEKLTEDIFNIIAENPSAFNTYDPIDSDDIDYIYKQCEVLQSLGLGELTRLYLTFVEIKTKIGERKENTDKILNLAKRNMERL